ncbi:MAG TPA: 7-cyano-7-deazaguanine synthase QueC [Thermoplasmata archaeon]|nr:7-cyano-7-deazaguanine synthase QueC [Thermoplasmata archaeon]
MSERSHGAVVLLSGGMDSATCLAIARRAHARVAALTVVYGQRHAREIRSARALARHFRVREHTVVSVPLAHLVRSALTDRRREIPASGPRPGRIPSTYVPARNTVLLALALGYAESRRADRIYIGANAIDYSGYPDCRPAFLRAFERTARLGTRAGTEGRVRLRIRAPLLRDSKTEIVRRGERLGVPWGLTWSCYRGGARPCGTCDSCRLRARGFRGAGVVDPLIARST